MRRSHAAALVAALPSFAWAVWPAPQESIYGQDILRLSSNFSVSLGDQLEGLSDLQTAAIEAQDRILTDNLRLLRPDRGSSLTDEVQAAPELSNVQLSLSGDCSGSSELVDISAESVKPLGTRDETYQLDISNDAANIQACSALGLFRGLTTFEQLVFTLPPAAASASKRRKRQAEEERVHFIQNAPLSISDSPAFPWRGILLDTSRNFYPASAVKKLILTSSAAKLSVFYWHITDSQSFPLEMTNPDLVNITTLSAYDPSSVYTVSDIEEIIAYGNRLGIDIIFEIDSPGHTASIGSAYPDLIACLDQSPWSDYAVQPQTGQINIAKQKAVELAQSIYADLAGRSNSPYLSTGGDEVNMPCYERDEVQDPLQRSGQTVDQALHSYTDAIHGTVRDAGKTPVVWQEQILDHDVGLAGTDTVVLVWTNSKAIADVVEQGNPLVHAASDYFYLDCGAGGWLGDFLGASWCDYVSWQQMYSFDPTANMTASQAESVLGGQANLWSEQTDETNLEEVVWPRAAAMAEVFWTGKADQRDATEALHRLHEFRFRLVERGVRARPLQPEWCALRPNRCDLNA